MGANYSLSISTDKTCYRPGEQVTGSITLSLPEEANLSEAYIKLKGKESTSWSEVRDYGKPLVTNTPAPRETGASMLMTRSISRQASSREGSSVILRERASIYKFDKPLQAGVYTFPFTISVPLDLPSGSMSGKLTDKTSNSHAYSSTAWSITYALKAVVSGRGIFGKKHKHTAELLIKERLPLKVEGARVIQEAFVRHSGWSGYCCGPVADSREELSADKDAYTPGEVISIRSPGMAEDRKVTLVRRCKIVSNDGSVVSERIFIAQTYLEDNSMIDESSVINDDHGSIRDFSVKDVCTRDTPRHDQSSNAAHLSLDQSVLPLNQSMTTVVHHHSENADVVEHSLVDVVIDEEEPEHKTAQPATTEQVYHVLDTAEGVVSVGMSATPRAVEEVSRTSSHDTSDQDHDGSLDESKSNYDKENASSKSLNTSSVTTGLLHDLNKATTSKLLNRSASPASADTRYLAPQVQFVPLKTISEAATKQPRKVQSSGCLRVPEGLTPSCYGKIITIEYTLELSGNPNNILPCSMPIRIYNPLLAAESSGHGTPMSHR